MLLEGARGMELGGSQRILEQKTKMHPLRKYFFRTCDV
uniref:Uncharacterized protein n=1 Tax=Anguilla anguilla TaxID=7936 RepID=A0A0E9VST0_ANGAN